MSSIQNVVVVGAGGNVGPHIIAALLESSYTVTALTRATSSSTFPPEVHVVKTDYTPSSLESALQGKDAVICTLGYAGLAKQFDIIDAAEKVGVKRFVPSEFGSPKGDNDLPEFTALLGNKLKVVEYLKEKAAKNPNFTWSAFTTGTFLDRALATFPDFGFDVQRQCATIFDSGNEPFTAMTIATIGKPVAASLEKLEDTKNRSLHVSSVKTTQNEILAAFESQTGTRWEKKTVSTKDVLRDAKAKMENGDFKGGYVGFMVANMFEDGAGRGVVDGVDNDLLSVPQERLDEILERILVEV